MPESHDFTGNYEICHKCGKTRAMTTDSAGQACPGYVRARGLRIADDFDYIRARRAEIAAKEQAAKFVGFREGSALVAARCSLFAARVDRLIEHYRGG